jgi:hypothetical protein
MMPNLSPPSPGRNIAVSERGADPVRNGGQKPTTDVAPERFVDGFEATKISHQNGRALGCAAWIRQQFRELFVEHQTIAKFGEGVSARFGLSLGHFICTDQPPTIHRYRLDPKRAALRKGDLAIALAIVGSGVAVDTIEKFGVAEQLFENQVRLTKAITATKSTCLGSWPWFSM